MDDSPNKRGGKPVSSQEDNPELDQLIALGIGTVVFWVLVLILTLTANVSWRAAIGFYVLTAISLVGAGALAVTWTPFYEKMLGRAGGSKIAEPLLKWFRKAGGKVAAHPPFSLLSRIPFNRRNLGLWIPFVINLLEVGWLIYFSGGIVKSPFAAVPVIMFTLVVLLIDLPAAVQRDEESSRNGEGDNPGPTTDEGQLSKILVFPFKVLAAVALCFFGGMIALNILHPWDLEQSPTDGATLTMTIAIAIVGIGFAAVARASILREGTGD